MDLFQVSRTYLYWPKNKCHPIKVFLLTWGSPNLTIDMSHSCYKCFDTHALKVRALFFLDVILNK